MQLDEIQQIFFLECDEGLAAIEACFGLCRDGAHDDETINTIFRAIHSIKGGAGAFGLEALQAFSHHYETVLDQVRTGALPLTPALLATLIAAFDMLADHVAAAKGEREPPADAAVLARLAGASEEPAAAAPALDPAPLADDLGFDDLMAMLETSPPGPDTPVPSPGPWRVAFRPQRQAFDHGGEPLLLLRELVHLGGTIVEVDISAVPSLHAIDPAEAYFGWVVRMPGGADEADLRSIFDFVTGLCTLDIARFDAEPAPPRPLTLPLPPKASPPAPIPAPPTPPEEPRMAAPTAVQQTIRVDLDKLDRLVNLVGELVITQAMLAQRLSAHGLAALSELTDLDHLTRELQDSAMSIRAQPMKSVFSRVPRIIRELEADTGKRVRLEMVGEMTEVDKTVVERIGEPLTHLIRNAVDHGIEPPEERIAAGKPAEGTVRLTAEHRSGRIVISIADDGRGIDRRRVREKAVERGIVPVDAVLADEEIDNLIFAPGFSTAATVSNISGRGVGMDVVRKNVQALGGRIGIASRFGHGSTFSLSLPLTLAVLDGMIVSVGDQTYVIPLGHIVESLRPQLDHVKDLGASASLLDVRGAYLPIHRVGRLLGVSGAEDDATRAVLIVVETDAGRAVLMVDAIQDQRQVVVKSLEANYSAIHGLAGATILGDGRVALILDVDALVSRRRGDLSAIGIAA